MDYTNFSREQLRTLIESLKAEIADYNRTKIPLSIAMFDIDDFKKVNDRKGHVYGDQVLVDVAALINKSIRDTDLVGRYGGEEFMVIFKEANLVTASIIAERIRKAVEKHIFNEGITITISGVKQYEGENLKDFIHEADKNLYKAKHNGKNQVI